VRQELQNLTSVLMDAAEMLDPIWRIPLDLVQRGLRYCRHPKQALVRVALSEVKFRDHVVTCRIVVDLTAKESEECGARSYQQISVIFEPRRVRACEGLPRRHTSYGGL